MRRFLPHRRFRIETALPPHEIAERLTAATLVKSWRPTPTELPFSGWVRDTRFSLHRVPHELKGKGGIRLNSFIPRIHGQIIATPQGSVIEGTMTLAAVVFVLLLVWVGALSRILLMLLLGGWRTGAGRWSDVIQLACMLVGGLAFFLFMFRRELQRSRELLSSVMGADDGR